MKWTTLSTEYLVTHPPFFTARRDRCVRPDGVEIPTYYVVEMAPAAVTFGLTAAGEVVMVRQYRYPVEEASLELPGGFAEAGETPAQAARREMLEETGYVFTNWKPLGRMAANPGILNNFTYFFLATGGILQQQQQPDVQEALRTELVAPERLKAMLLQQQLIQSLHANACFYALLELGFMK